MIPGTPDGGNKVICRYTGCTLQTFVKHYESGSENIFVCDVGLLRQLSCIELIKILIMIIINQCYV